MCSALGSVLVTAPSILSIVSAKYCQVITLPGTSMLTSSEIGLPMSRQSSKARSSAYCSNRRAILNMTSMRERGAMRHLGQHLARGRVQRLEARAGGGVDELAADEQARLRLDPDGPFMPVAGRGAVGGGRGHVRSPAVGFRPAGGPRARRGQRCTPRPGQSCYVIT